jgi:hypothetical protein
MTHATSGDSEQLEKRRRRAVQLLESGRSLSAVARQVRAAVSSVFRSQQAYQRKGARGLDAKPIPVTLLGQGPSTPGIARSSGRCRG